MTKRRNPTPDEPALREHDELQLELDRRIAQESGLHDRIAIQQRRGVETEGLFKLLVNNVADYAIFLLDPAGYVATWNSGAQRIKGYAADEVIGRHFSVFYPEDELRAGKCEAELSGALRDGRFEDEGWRVRKNGTQFWANVVMSPVRDHADRLVGFAQVTCDLTDRRRRAEQRLSAEERFRLLVESVQDYALFILDADGKVATWNAGAQRIKGYAADEIIGSHFSRFYPRSDVNAGKCELELDVAARQGRFEDEGWRIRKDGSQFWANVVISAIRDKEGSLVGFSKVTRDLTDRKRNEEERTARLAAEQANRTKDEFLAMLGHELRNPLAPILTALQLIKLRADPRSAREHEIIERQMTHLLRLVDDLLDVSRIAQGKIEIMRKPLDVRDVVAKAIEIATPLFEQRHHHVEVNRPPQPLMVEGDEGRLIQVTTNLLTNAARYTEPGGHVTVTMQRTGGDVQVEVCDDGAGIDAELLPRVFELFVQGQQSPDRRAGGLGLGLTLVRSLVDLHGGQVEARSAGPGQGSSFTVHLPAVDPPIPTVEESLAAPPAPQIRSRIAIVDDNDDARLLLCDLLTELGHDVQGAGDGLHALALIGEFRPDIAILDIGLPGMDGYELAAQLRETLKADSPRLIALTGYGQDSDHQRSQTAGFDRHLVKPVQMRRLLAAIADLQRR